MTMELTEHRYDHPPLSSLVQALPETEVRAMLVAILRRVEDPTTVQSVQVLAAIRVIEDWAPRIRTAAETPPLAMAHHRAADARGEFVQCEPTTCKTCGGCGDYMGKGSCPRCGGSGKEPSAHPALARFRSVESAYQTGRQEALRLALAATRGDLKAAAKLLELSYATAGRILAASPEIRAWLDQMPNRRGARRGACGRSSS